MDLQWFLVLGAFVTVILAIGAFAIWGVRKARALSKSYVENDEAKSAGRETPKDAIRREFLRPMSHTDVIAAIVGAIVLWFAVRAARDFFR